MNGFIADIRRIATEKTGTPAVVRGPIRAVKLWLRLDRPGRLRRRGGRPASPQRAIEIDLRQQEVIFDGDPIKLG
ncbi:hypothetical protein QE436_000903 [Pantoea anthophila]|nr:hypothetical protein [Pantoea anthophila]